MAATYNAGSILHTVKKALGIDAGYTAFDPDIIMHVNSAFDTLHQLGVGPEPAYSIEDDSSEWSDFLADRKDMDSVKTYVYLRTRQLFDPPSNSFVMEAIDKKISEIEWRLNVSSETPADNSDVKG